MTTTTQDRGRRALAALAALAMALTIGCGPDDGENNDPSGPGPGGEPAPTLGFDPDAQGTSLTYSVSGPVLSATRGPVVVSSGGERPAGSALTTLDFEWGEDGRPTEVSGIVTYADDASRPDASTFTLEFRVPLDGPGPWTVPIDQADGAFQDVAAGAVIGASGQGTGGERGSVSGRGGTVTIDAVDGLISDVGLFADMGRGTALIEGSFSANGVFRAAGSETPHTISGSFVLLERDDEMCCSM